MPLITTSSYSPSPIFKSGHLSTIYPTLFRKINPPPFVREQLTTPDGDFLHLDWLKSGNNNMVILCHGLEGNSASKYMLGMANIFSKNAWDVAAMNYRGCSGVPNETVRTYHSGATDDLDLVVQHVENQHYQKIVLIGFSLGGNLILKYAGEQKYPLTSKLDKIVIFSVPVDLAGSSLELSKMKNWLYTKRFLLKLSDKISDKAERFPELVSPDQMKNVSNLIDFDNYYTAPIHGFKDAEDYYRQNNSRQFLHQIDIPTLLVNAKNDPFLNGNCYPYEIAEKNEFLFMETPLWGGHVGFVDSGEFYWSEKRAIEFVS